MQWPLCSLGYKYTTNTFGLFIHIAVWCQWTLIEMPLLGFETIRIMSCSIFTVQQNLVLLWKTWLNYAKQILSVSSCHPSSACTLQTTATTFELLTASFTKFIEWNLVWDYDRILNNSEILNNFCCFMLHIYAM